MIKEEFIQKYELSDAVPIDPTARTVPAEAFAEALTEFINDRFRGIARVSTDIISAEAVLISAEYAAHFFKMLLTYIYGRIFIDIDVSCNREGLTILISSENDLPITDTELRFLIKTARNAGMEIYPDGKKIKLSLKFSRAATYRVYAVSVSDGRRVMLAKLNEIFFCGAPYNVSATKSKK